MVTGGALGGRKLGPPLPPLAEGCDLNMKNVTLFLLGEGGMDESHAA